MKLLMGEPAMAVETSVQCSAKICPTPGNLDRKSERESPQRHECQPQSQPFSLNPETDSDKQILYSAGEQIHQDSSAMNKNERGAGKEDDSRRRVARGPRSCSCAGGGGSRSSAKLLSMYAIPWEDHRVVSIEYQCSGTQALMRVTLLAAGFVIGARGNSARLIGQATGAIVQSWTETDWSHGGANAVPVPIRLFRIQGKKRLVQAAVHLIDQAVAKYRELCERKRRGEFVQREHIIDGVEFYYQPPPKKAFQNNTGASYAATTAKKLDGSVEDGRFSLPPSSSNPVITSTQNNYNAATVHKNSSNDHNIMGWHNKHSVAHLGNNVWSMPQLHSRWKHQRFYSYDAAYHQRFPARRTLNMNFKCPYCCPLFFDCHSFGFDAHQLPKFQGNEAEGGLDSLKQKKLFDEEFEASSVEANMSADEVISLEEKMDRLRLDDEQAEANEKRVVDLRSLLIQKKERHEQMSSSLFSYFGRGEQFPMLSASMNNNNSHNHMPPPHSSPPADNRVSVAPFDFSSYKY